MDLDEASQVALSAATRLTEWFDMVLVIGTATNENGTVIVTQWVGDYYAARGAAQDFLNDDQAKEEDTE
jgi:hypothetical protein